MGLYLGIRKKYGYFRVSKLLRIPINWQTLLSCQNAISPLDFVHQYPAMTSLICELTYYLSISKHLKNIIVQFIDNNYSVLWLKWADILGKLSCTIFGSWSNQSIVPNKFQLKMLWFCISLRDFVIVTIFLEKIHWFLPVHYV